MTAPAFSPDQLNVPFRYRDLVASTLKEHRDVIGQKKSCWWGWWRRPSEDLRPEVWNALEAAIKSSGGAWVGLMNSGSGQVHAAYVVEVRRPLESHAEGTLPGPELSSKERRLIPAYYRDSPFSAAWMRMERIDVEPIEFFGKFAYASVPRLRGIPDHYLERLQKKVVVDVEELRAMDTTIWLVRPKKSGDRAEKFLAPTVRVNRAVSDEPIRVQGDHFVHLTDVHFATGANRAQHAWGFVGEKPSDLAAAVARALHGYSVAGLIITGDFSFQARHEEFAEACKTLTLLLGALNLGPDQVVIVPGNHDIAWTKDPGAIYDPSQPVSNATDDAKKEYIEFYRSFVQHDPNDRLSMGRRFVLPNDMVVEVCGLNTSDLEQGKEYLAGMGRTDPTAFGEACDILRWRPDEPSMALKVLALHHHVTATEDVESPSEYKKGFGMAIDAKRTLREAARRGVQMILHGHRHRAFFWRETVYELPEETKLKWHLGNVAVLGGGSTGSTDVIDKKNFFEVIRLTPEAVSVTSFQSKACAEFLPFSKWKASVALSDGRLTLGNWEPEK